MRHERGYERWPCLRLRAGFGLTFFFFFETLIGRQLPLPIPYLALVLGSLAFASAFSALRSWKLAYQVALIEDAVARRRSGR
ncbi:MAG: hypothetical protein H6729_04685 [Deltaproteobacteria bacterium]|nr:hypothetical protein [Deltaproteobacteria bacterium]